MPPENGQSKVEENLVDGTKCGTADRKDVAIVDGMNIEIRAATPASVSNENGEICGKPLVPEIVELAGALLKPKAPSASSVGATVGPFGQPSPDSSMLPDSGTIVASGALERDFVPKGMKAVVQRVAPGDSHSAVPVVQRKEAKNIQTIGIGDPSGPPRELYDAGLGHPQEAQDAVNANSVRKPPVRLAKASFAAKARAPAVVCSRPVADKIVVTSAAANGKRSSQPQTGSRAVVASAANGDQTESEAEPETSLLPLTGRMDVDANDHLDRILARGGIGTSVADGEQTGTGSLSQHPSGDMLRLLIQRVNRLEFDVQALKKRAAIEEQGTLGEDSTAAGLKAAVEALAAASSAFARKRDFDSGIVTRALDAMWTDEAFPVVGADGELMREMARSIVAASCKRNLSSAASAPEPPTRATLSTAPAKTTHVPNQHPTSLYQQTVPSSLRHATHSTYQQAQDLHIRDVTPFPHRETFDAPVHQARTSHTHPAGPGGNSDGDSDCSDPMVPTKVRVRM
jgi:hypothetical protein